MKKSKTYPHRGMKRPGDLIVLFEPRAASEDLRKPECADCTLHVPDLALAGSGCLDPLRRLSSYTAYHVRMGQGLGALSTLADIQCRRERLGDSGVEGRGPAGDDQAVVAIVSGGWAVAVAGARAKTE